MKHFCIEDLPASQQETGRRIYAFCGAGGKTSGIHALRDYYLALNKKVLVTTTTHMIYEDGCVSSVCDALSRLETDGYAFAGIETVTGKPAGGGSIRKVRGLSDADRFMAEQGADVVLIEADGSRRLPFKVPKPWEPVIPEETTDVILVMGLDAVGRRISDVCYNSEGVAAVLGVTADTRLTQQMMLDACMRTYVELIHRQRSGAAIYLYMNEKIPGRSIVDCGVYAL